MANKRINELALRTPQTTDLMLIGDPTTGYSYKTTLLSALNLGVPTTRTITINGTTFDLSANRSWSVGTVTSVGLTMPAAFNVASSPVTGSGTIAVTAAGLASQYIRGDGTLADFPGGGGSGGASVSYYLNGSVNQGTLGGVTYYEMNKTPILGAGTNFTTSSNGYIASFLTDAGDPALLKIPGGNWNTEFYFAASSGGGTPTYYLELYKYDGTTFTLIASNSSNPDAITGGTSIEQYFTTLAVPETILTATDRLAIRIYVTTAGRTITLHTENSNLCQIITTFTTGLTALNGLTAQVQYFATGSAGTDFNISSSTATHTFNIPTASATNRGLLSTADWTTFNNKVSSIIAGNAITVSNASGNVTVNHADTSGADPGATISGSNVFRSIVLDTYGHITGLSWSPFLISDLGGTAISSPSNGQVLSYNGTNWVNSSLSGLSIITGSGTTNWVPKFTSSSAIGLSNIYDGGSFIGVFTATDNLSGAKLQVSGAATFSGNLFIGATSGSNTAGFTNRLYLEGNLPSLTLSNTGTNTGKFTFGVTNGNLGIWNNATSTYPLFINSSNNVGIGTTNPTSLLEVVSSTFTQIKSSNFATTGANRGSSFRVTSTTNGGTSFLGDLNAISNNALAPYNSVDGVYLMSRTAGFPLGFTVNNSGTEIVALSIASTGAATFSSSVTAGGIIAATNADIYSQNGTGSNLSIGFKQADAVKYRLRYDIAADTISMVGSSGNFIQTWNQSGNLGLGVTPSAWGSGYTALQIENTGFMADADRIWMYANGYFNGTSNLYIQNGFASRYYQASGQHIWDTAPSGTAGNAITFTQAMTLDASGRLGIGTTSLGERLNVNGGIGLQHSASQKWHINTAADNNLYFTRSGIDTRMTITSDGNVGIGTTVPNANLQIMVNNTSAASNTYFRMSGQGNGAYGGNQFIEFTYNDYGNYGYTYKTAFIQSISTANGGDNASGTLIFATKSSSSAYNSDPIERMRITSSGRTLIGTTTDNTVDLLQVAGSGVFNSAANGSSLTANYTANDGGINSINAGTLAANRTAQLRLGNGTTFFGANDRTYQLINIGTSSTAADFYIQYWNGSTYSERLRITSSGNVGIGVNAITSGTKLEIAGNVSIKAGTDGYFQTTDGNNVILRADQQSGTNGKGVRLQYWNGSAWQNSLSIDNVTSGFSNLLLQPSGGNVLIGNTAGNGYKLEVFGSTQAGNTFGQTFAGVGAYSQWITSGGAFAMGLDGASGATERLRITSGGEVYIAGTTDQGAYNLQVNGTGVWGAGAYVNGSDIRLKENISPIKTALEYVNKMNPISFKYKESYSKDQNIQPGFIAQELKELFKDEIWVNGIVSEGTDYLNVAYQNIIPLLTKAIQELKTELDTLKK